MSGSHDDNGPAAVLELIHGCFKSKVLFVACELGVFDALADDSENGKTAEQLATEMSTDVDATERFLNACVGLKLLEKSVVDENNVVYSNTALASTYLTTNSRSLKGLVGFSNWFTWPLLSHLENAVKEGANQVSRNFGISEGALYKDIFANEVSTRNFVAGMHGMSLMSAPSVARAVDLSDFKTACDFGGGSGALAHEISRVYPKMSIKVLELPPVAKIAHHFEPKDGVTRNVQFVAGDFFEEEFPEADLYIFSLIIHNWKADKIDQLLKKTYKALKPEGAILIAEGLLDDEKTNPKVLMRCMLMLVGSEGRERSAKEYRQLLEKHGFQDIQFKRTGVPLDVIFARRH